VVTEATSPAVFEFITDGERRIKPGKEPMRATNVHRYEIVPTATDAASPTANRSRA
jgi:hypothetical protein